MHSVSVDIAQRTNEFFEQNLAAALARGGKVVNFQVTAKLQMQFDAIRIKINGTTNRASKRVL